MVRIAPIDRMGPDWNPENLYGEMNHTGAGVYTWEALIPEGDWEYKVVLNQNWDQDTYGNGGNFSVSSNGLDSTVFYYDFKQNSTYHQASDDCPFMGDVNADSNVMNLPEHCRIGHAVNTV